MCRFKMKRICNKNRYAVNFISLFQDIWLLIADTFLWKAVVSRFSTYSKYSN